MGKKQTISLDWKDRKVLQELDRNARQSAAEIAKKTGMSKQTVAYRISNLTNAGFIKQFISLIDAQSLGYTFYFVLIKMRHCRKEEEARQIQRLKKMPEVNWLASLRGEWKLLVCTICRGPHEFNNALESILDIIREKVTAYEFFILLEAVQLPYREVLGEKGKAYPAQSSMGRRKEFELKKSDEAVLAQLAVDGRMQKKAIAEKTGLTMEMVRHSMRRLERSGTIQAYKPLLDVSKAGYSWHMMLVQLKYSTEKQKDDFLNFLKGIPQVFYINKGVGNWSFSVEFHTKDLEEFSVIHEMIKEKFEDIIANESVVQIVREHKCVFFPVKNTA